jgi:hypothetical protein
MATKRQINTTTNQKHAPATGETWEKRRDHRGDAWGGAFYQCFDCDEDALVYKYKINC